MAIFNKVKSTLWRKEILVLTMVTILTIVIKMLWAADAPGPTVFLDELLYRFNASSVFQLRTYADAHYPPIYPLAIAPALYFDGWFKGMMLLNAFWSSLVIPATWLLARVAGLKYPLFASVLSALLPMQVIYPRHLMSENLFVPLFILALAFALRGFNRSSIEALAFGVILGITHLTRYLFLPSVPLLFAIWLFVGKKSLQGTPVKNVVRKIHPFFLALFTYFFILASWAVYAKYSGFGWKKMFGFGISGVRTDAINIEAFAMWAVAYTAYLLLSWLPVWGAISFWASQVKVSSLRGQFNSRQFQFIFSSSLLIGGYWLVAVQHSFGAAYNYPTPHYILGRYLMHLSPLMLVIGVLVLEKVQVASLGLKKIRYFSMAIATTMLVFVAWWILFENGIWTFTPWFAKISLNSVGVGSFSDWSVLLAVTVISVFFPLVCTLRSRINVPLLSLPMFVAFSIILYSTTITMAKAQSARHAREIASVFISLEQKNTPINIWTDIKFISEETLGNGLLFFKIPANKFSVKIISIEEGIDLTTINTPTLFLTKGMFDSLPLKEYMVSNQVFRIYRIDEIEAFRPKILAFGPTSVVAGSLFNAQPSGDSAMWFKFASASHHAYMKLDNHRLSTTFGENDFVSAVIPSRYTTLPRVAKLRMFDPLTNLESTAVDLEILLPDGRY